MEFFLNCILNINRRNKIGFRFYNYLVKIRLYIRSEFHTDIEFRTNKLYSFSTGNFLFSISINNSFNGKIIIGFNNNFPLTSLITSSIFKLKVALAGCS